MNFAFRSPTQGDAASNGTPAPRAVILGPRAEDPALNARVLERDAA